MEILNIHTNVPAWGQGGAYVGGGSEGESPESSCIQCHNNVV
jgi:hypothetical protein